MSYPWDTHRQGYLQQQNIPNQTHLQGNKTGHQITTANIHVSSPPLEGPRIPHAYAVQVPNYGLNPNLPAWTPHQGHYNHNVHWNKQVQNSYEQVSNPWPYYAPVPGNNTIGQKNSPNVPKYYNPVDSEWNNSQIWVNNQQLNRPTSTIFPGWKPPENEQKGISHSLTHNTMNHQDQIHSNFSNWNLRSKTDFVKPTVCPTFGPLIRTSNVVDSVTNSCVSPHLPPPPLPLEEPPPPPRFPLPPPPPVSPPNNTAHHNAAVPWVKWNASSNMQLLQIPISQGQHEKKYLHFDKEPFCGTLLKSKMQTKYRNDDTKQNQSKKNNLFSSQDETSLNTIHNSNLGNHPSEEDNRFADALSQLQGLSKQWTAAPTSPNSTKRTRNQKKKEKKRQKRKDERIKLMELLKEPDHEDLSDFKLIENPSERGYRLSDYVNCENKHKPLEYSPSKIQHFMADENLSRISGKEKAQDEEMEISDGDEAEVTKVIKIKQQFKKNEIQPATQETLEVHYPKHQSPEVIKSLDVLPSKAQLTDSILKADQILTIVVEEEKENTTCDEVLKLLSIPLKLHVSLPDVQSETKEDNKYMLFPPSKKSTAANACEESLIEKKERLARALKRIALEKAKVKLKMAQKKRQKALAHASPCQQKLQINETIRSTTPTITETTDQMIIRHKSIASIQPPETLNVISSKSQHVEQRLKLRDITAYCTSHLIIRNIGSSGPQDKIRVNANKALSLVSSDEEHVSEDQFSDEDAKGFKENVSYSIDTTYKVQAKSNSYKSASQTKGFSVPSNQSKEVTSDTRLKTKSIKQNLQLLKSRLRLKLMEKARLERKRKFNAEAYNETKPMKELKKDHFEFRHQEARYNKIKEENINLKGSCMHADSSKITSCPESPLLSCVSNSDAEKINQPLSKVETQSRECDNVEKETEGDAVKKKFVFLLKERQRILKNNIDSSKINQRELKYNMEISSLNILVNRQKESLAKQGEKISKNSSMIKECSKELNQHNQSIVISNKRIHELQKRKRIMEKMLLTVTRKLIDGRKSRNEFSTMRSRSKRKQTIRPHLDIPKQDVEEGTI